MVKLDTVLFGAKFDYIKVDIEGSEWELLAELLEEDLGLRKEIVIELHNLSKVTHQLFAGYVISILKNINYFFCHQCSWQQ